MQRVHCPRHDEKTPSLVVYDDYAYCYGGCGRITLSELERDGIHINAAVRPAPVDLEADLERIKALPLASVRGLQLPVDGDSFYVLWPSGDYYKRRRFLSDNGSKYYCPRGHKKPLFVPHLQPKSKVLAIVEGELNALSIASLKPKFSVCSLGGCGDFKNSEKYISFCLQFASFIVIVDRDEAGLGAAIALKKTLLRFTPKIDVVLMDRDANDLLVSGELEKEVQEWAVKLNGVAGTDAGRKFG